MKMNNIIEKALMVGLIEFKQDLDEKDFDLVRLMQKKIDIKVFNIMLKMFAINEIFDQNEFSNLACEINKVYSLLIKKENEIIKKDKI